MLYAEATIHIVPGKLEEFKKVFEEQYLPVSLQFGRKFMGAWETSKFTPVNKIEDKSGNVPDFVWETPDVVEVIDMWAYDDEAHMEEVEAKIRDESEYKSAAANLSKTMLDECSRIIIPFSYSPLQ
jgi:hypothetical protein